MTADDLAHARDLVLLEGWLLDTHAWDEWLELYAPTASYWLPCWLDDDNYTRDPQREMSLIYYSNRTGLEDRIFRIRTGQSLASTPLPRTCHITSIIQVVAQQDAVRVDSNWVVHSYRLGVSNTFYGQQTHQLQRMKDRLVIVERKIILANDVIPNVLDIYSV